MKIRTENIVVIELPVIEVQELYKQLNEVISDDSIVVDLDKYPFVKALLEGLYSTASYLIDEKVDDKK